MPHREGLGVTPRAIRPERFLSQSNPVNRMQRTLSTKELVVIENLEGHQNQRKLAEATGFSLGMTNLLLKRLVKKGHVKVSTLNGRTLKYILTPAGFAEKVKRSYQYMVRSIRFLNEMRARIRGALEANGAPRVPVFIVGQNELAELAGEVVAELGITAEWISAGDWLLRCEGLPSGGLCLLCDPDVPLSAELDGSSGLVVLQLPGLMGQGGAA